MLPFFKTNLQSPYLHLGRGFQLWMLSSIFENYYLAICARKNCPSTFLLPFSRKYAQNCINNSLVHFSGPAVVVKSKLSLCSGSVALRQLNPVHKKDHKVFFRPLALPFLISYELNFSHNTVLTKIIPGPVIHATIEVYAEFFGADQYIHWTYKGTTMVGAEQVNIQNLSCRCSKNALPGPVCSQISL